MNFKLGFVSALWCLFRLLDSKLLYRLIYCEIENWVMLTKKSDWEPLLAISKTNVKGNPSLRVNWNELDEAG